MYSINSFGVLSYIAIVLSIAISLFIDTKLQYYSKLYRRYIIILIIGLVGGFVIFNILYAFSDSIEYNHSMLGGIFAISIFWLFDNKVIDKYIILCLLILQSIGKFGCYTVGCCNSNLLTNQFIDLQIIELSILLILMYIISFSKKYYIIIYIISYSLLRIGSELYRDEQVLMIFNIRASILLCLLMQVVYLIKFSFNKIKK
jgi:hypothetical protein